MKSSISLADCLQDAVDGADKIDEIIHSAIALGSIDAGVLGLSLELERMRADERLRASEASYREIFDASDSALRLPCKLALSLR